MNLSLIKQSNVNQTTVMKQRADLPSRWGLFPAERKSTTASSGQREEQRILQDGLFYMNTHTLQRNTLNKETLNKQ